MIISGVISESCKGGEKEEESNCAKLRFIETAKHTGDSERLLYIQFRILRSMLDENIFLKAYHCA